MTDPQPVAGLGNLVRSYQTESGRRFGVAAGCLAVGVVAALIGLPLAANYLADANSPGFSPLPGAVVGLAVIMLFTGGLRLTQGLLRPGERFDLYEHGFVHHTSRADRVVPWSDVVDVEQRGEYKDGLPHVFGTDYRCIVKVRSGPRIKFSTYTDSADFLGRAIANRNSGKP